MSGKKKLAWWFDKTNTHYNMFFGESCISFLQFKGEKYVSNEDMVNEDNGWGTRLIQWL